MNKYVYPAIFTKEDNGLYSIRFPDFESCYTCGDDLKDGYLNAEDILCYTLYQIEKNGEEIPAPSDVTQIKFEANEFVSLIFCDTYQYYKFERNKAVKKNCTIPEWLCEEAEKANINFSQLLQLAIKKELGIAE